MIEGLSERRIAALCGIGGSLALVAYFAAPVLLGWPYAGASPQAIAAYATRHDRLFYAGAGLQVTGTFLCVVFFLALLRLSDAAPRLAGMVLVVAATSLVATAVVEAALLVAVPMAAAAGDMATVATTFAMSNGVFVRIFPLAPASATYVALGAVLLGARVIDRRFGYAALAMGLAFEVAGLLAILADGALLIVAILAAGQVAWVVAASIGLLRSAEA